MRATCETTGIRTNVELIGIRKRDRGFGSIWLLFTELQLSLAKRHFNSLRLFLSSLLRACVAQRFNLLVFWRLFAWGIGLSFLTSLYYYLILDLRQDVS